MTVARHNRPDRRPRRLRRFAVRTYTSHERKHTGIRTAGYGRGLAAGCTAAGRVAALALDFRKETAAHARTGALRRGARRRVRAVVGRRRADHGQGSGRRGRSGRHQLRALVLDALVVDRVFFSGFSCFSGFSVTGVPSGDGLGVGVFHRRKSSVRGRRIRRRIRHRVAGCTSVRSKFARHRIKDVGIKKITHV